MAIIHQQLENGSYEFILDEPFIFESQQSIQPLVLVYETFGTLNANKDNVILIHHSLSTHSHVCAHPKNPKKGWWEDLVGPGRAIDTNCYYVICINNIGSCFGSSGPASINAATGQVYADGFPALTIGDMVRSQKILLDYLKLTHLYAVIGNSMGAMLSLDWSIRYPDSVDHLISVSSCYKAYPVNVAYHVLQKEIIRLDPKFSAGQELPIDGFLAARKLGLLSYRHPAELNARFLENNEINRYLDYNARRFVNNFNIYSYLRIIDAMDSFDVTKSFKNPIETFESIRAKILVIAVDSDLLFPSEQQRDLYHILEKAKRNVHFIKHHSDYGHDAFYADLTLGKYLQDFLAPA